MMGLVEIEANSNKTRRPISSHDIKWIKKIWHAKESPIDLNEYSKETATKQVIERAGCCQLPYEMNFKPEWREFRLAYGSARYPCCAGDLQWIGNRTTGYEARPRPLPVSLTNITLEHKVDLVKAFHGETVIVAGDSVARQLVMAMMCAMNERPNHLSKGGTRQTWSNGSDLVAEFSNLTIVRSGERGRLPLVATSQIAQRAPKPLTLVLVAGGSNGLGQHWHIGKCSQDTEKCRLDYAKAANATLLQASKLNATTLVVVGATPTHFPTQDGDFRGEITNEKLTDLSQGCRATQFPDHWRNNILKTAARAVSAHYVDSFPLFAPFADAHLDRIVKYSNPFDALGPIEDDVPANFYPHMRREFPGNVDCLHFCMHRAVWYPLLQSLVHLKL